jgi:hypothetical protein
MPWRRAPAPAALGVRAAVPPEARTPSEAMRLPQDARAPRHLEARAAPRAGTTFMPDRPDVHHAVQRSVRDLPSLMRRTTAASSSPMSGAHGPPI